MPHVITELRIYMLLSLYTEPEAYMPALTRTYYAAPVFLLCRGYHAVMQLSLSQLDTLPKIFIKTRTHNGIMYKYMSICDATQQRKRQPNTCVCISYVRVCGLQNLLKPR